jgi:hypothetical protein
MSQDTQKALAPCIEAVNAIAGIREKTGRRAPDVIT